MFNSGLKLWEGNPGGLVEAFAENVPFLRGSEDGERKRGDI